MKLFTTIRFIPVLIGLLSTVLFTECKRTVKDEEILGPEYRPAPEGFAIITPLDASDLSVNFKTSPKYIYFTADFSHEVSWTLVLTGETSGAQKTLTGLSGSLNASNSTWHGEASTNRFFTSGENVTAVLTFLGSSVTDSLTLNILASKAYKNSIDGIAYYLIEDFEITTGDYKYNMASPYNDQPDAPIVNGATGDIQLQGDNVYHFSGMDKNSNSWIAGLTTDSLNIDSAFRASAVSPDDFFINLYVYGTGKPNSSIQIKTYEIDDWSAAAYSQKYDQTINDGWVYDIYVDWTGWKLVSVRYSQFKRASDPTLGGNGNGVKQPQNITGFGLGLNSIPTFGMEVEAYVDFMTVTVGGAFKP